MPGVMVSQHAGGGKADQLFVRGVDADHGPMSRSSPTGYLIFDVIAGKPRGSVDLNLTINNALEADWREAQFAETSRVTPTGELVEQMHYTPGMPLTATLTAAYKW